MRVSQSIKWSGIEWDFVAIIDGDSVSGIERVSVNDKPVDYYELHEDLIEAMEAEASKEIRFNPHDEWGTVNKRTTGVI